jgi:hypothetical protein
MPERCPAGRRITAVAERGEPPVPSDGMSGSGRERLLGHSHSFVPLQWVSGTWRVACKGRAASVRGMSEQALAFGMMGLFLFFVALAVSGLDVGTCPQCEHCRELRRSEEEHRRAVRVELDERYRSRSYHRPEELARRQAILRAQRQRATRSSDHRDN